MLSTIQIVAVSPTVGITTARLSSTFYKFKDNLLNDSNQTFQQISNVQFKLIRVDKTLL